MNEKQGILEDGDSDRRDGADGTDHHAGSIQLYVDKKGAKGYDSFVPFIISPCVRYQLSDMLKFYIKSRFLLFYVVFQWGQCPRQSVVAILDVFLVSA